MVRLRSKQEVSVGVCDRVCGRLGEVDEWETVDVHKVWGRCRISKEERARKPTSQIEVKLNTDAETVIDGDDNSNGVSSCWRRHNKRCLCLFGSVRVL